MFQKGISVRSRVPYVRVGGRASAFPKYGGGAQIALSARGKCSARPKCEGGATLPSHALNMGDSPIALCTGGKRPRAQVRGDGVPACPKCEGKGGARLQGWIGECHMHGGAP